MPTPHNLNQYPWWKYLLIGLVILWGLIFALPNLFGEDPAVQISGARANIVIDPAFQNRVAALLDAVGRDAGNGDALFDAVRRHWGALRARLPEFILAALPARAGGCSLERLAAAGRLGVAVRVGVASTEGPAEITERADVVVDGPAGLVPILVALGG